MLVVRQWGTVTTLDLDDRILTNGPRDKMHDLKSLSTQSAILRHGGEASTAQQAFEAMTPAQKSELLLFLKSLQFRIARKRHWTENRQMRTRHSERNRCAAFGRVMLRGKLPACVAIV